MAGAKEDIWGPTVPFKTRPNNDLKTFISSHLPEVPPHSNSSTPGAKSFPRVFEGACKIQMLAESTDGVF